jgi:outer membrane protein assembly factor BamB
MLRNVPPALAFLALSAQLSACSGGGAKGGPPSDGGAEGAVDGGDDGGNPNSGPPKCGDVGGLQANAPWPMEGACPTHVGRTTLPGPKNPTQAWSFTTTAMMHVRGSVAVGGDGTLYAGSADGNVYALSASGSKQWSFSAGMEVDATPAIGSDGTVYVGAADGTVYGIQGGTMKWNYKTSGAVRASANIGADHTVYFGSEDYAVYAFKMGGGNPLWFFMTMYYVDATPTLSIDGKTLYVASAFGDVSALPTGPSSGSPKPNWALQAMDPSTMMRILAPILGAAAVGADGTVYVGYGGMGSGSLVAIDASGQQKWVFTAGGPIAGSPAIGGDGNVYVASADNSLYAVDAVTGAKKWAFPTGGKLEASPTIDGNGTIYVGSDDGKLYAVGGDGTMKWAATLGGAVASAPSIGMGGMLYVGCDDGKVYAIGP